MKDPALPINDERYSRGSGYNGRTSTPGQAPRRLILIPGFRLVALAAPPCYHITDWGNGQQMVLACAPVLSRRAEPGAGRSKYATCGSEWKHLMSII